MSRRALPTAVAIALLCSSPVRAQQARDTLRRPAADTALRDAAADSAPHRMVQVGYGQRRADEVTGVVTQIDAAEFNPGRMVSLKQLVQGKVAGVQVVDNNDPGGSFSVRIRNPASLDGAEPLYVIDGVPIGAGLAGGAAADRDALNFLDPDDIASITVLRDGAAAAIYGMDAANGVVLITTKTAQGAPRLEYRGSASASTVTRLPDVLNAAEFRTAVTQYAPANLSLLGNVNTDWPRLVTQVAHGQAHHLALSGAGPAGAFRFSLGFLRQNGVLRATTTERLSLALRYDERFLGDLLDVHLLASGARLYDHEPPQGLLTTAGAMDPTQPTYDSLTASGLYERNPLNELSQFSSSGTTYRGMAHLMAGLRVPFVRGLGAQVNVADDGMGGDQHDSSSSPLAGVSETHGVPHHSGRYFEAQLTYATDRLPVPGRWDFLAGYERSRSHSTYSAFTALYGGLATTWADYAEDDTTRSYFGRVQYGLADRYFATASLRRDHSSRFASAHAYGTFPSAAFTWRVSQEPLLRNILAGTDLALRASTARTGDQNAISPSSLTSLTPVNPDARLERATSYDVGVDYGLFGGRISGSLDWYTKRTDGLYGIVPIPAWNGLSYLVTNVGNLRDQGVEASLAAQVLAPLGHGLGWRVAFTASRSTNRMLDLRTPPTCVSAVSSAPCTMVMNGQPYGTFDLYEQKYDAAGKPIEGSYVDVNGDSIPDLIARHDAAPRWILGHTSNLSWGPLDLSFTLRAYVGNWVYNAAAATNGYYALLMEAVPSNLDASALQSNFLHYQPSSDYYLEDASFLRMDNVTIGWTIRRGPEPMRLFVTVQNAFTITHYRGLDPASVPDGIDYGTSPPARTLVAGLDLRL